MRNGTDRYNAVRVESLQGVIATLDMIELARLRKRRVAPIEFAKPPSNQTVSVKT